MFAHVAEGSTPRVDVTRPKDSVTRSTPRVAVISLGGTIASSATPGVSGVTPRLDATDLLSGVGAVEEIASIDARAFRLVPSSDLSLSDVTSLVGEIHARLDEGAQGVVVTQGTDTLEEVAFALDLLVRRDEPVVVTGAMRHASDAGADGPANLLDALRVAAFPAARGLGALVVFNGEIHAARYVRKTHATSTATFRSTSLGPLGWVSEGHVRLGFSLPRWPDLNVSLEPPAPVALISASLGDSLALLDHVRAAGYRGVVVEALGGGHVPSRALERLEKLAREIPVVLASRTGAGETLTSTYRFAGSEIDLLARGLFGAGALDARKARILLSVLLGADTSIDGCRRAFVEVHDAMFRSNVEH